MSTFLSLLFSFLLALDPLGFSLIQGRTIVEKSFPEHAVTAIYPDKHLEIWFDSSYLSQVYRDEEESKKWAGCVLVHEGAHVRDYEQFGGTSEELAFLYQYLCLDRVGAPTWMKEYVYGLLQEKVGKGE